MGLPESAAPRPGGVTLLAVLIVISGLLQLMVAIGVLIARGDAEFVAQTGLSADVWLWVGIVGIIVAIVYLLVARGLMRGSGLARGLATLSALVSLAGGLWGVFTYGGNLQWSSILSVAVALIVLGLLWSFRASAFFRSR